MPRSKLGSAPPTASRTTSFSSHTSSSLPLRVGGPWPWPSSTWRRHMTVYPVTSCGLSLLRSWGCLLTYGVGWNNSIARPCNGSRPARGFLRPTLSIWVSSRAALPAPASSLFFSTRLPHT